MPRDVNKDLKLNVKNRCACMAYCKLSDSEMCFRSSNNAKMKNFHSYAMLWTPFITLP